MRRRDRTGLMKRNVYRFLIAIKDLTAKEQKAAMELFESDGEYYTTTLHRLKTRLYVNEHKRVKKAWESYQNALKQYGDD